MRLIDADALKKKLSPIKLFGGVYCKAITEKDIDNAPTVEVKPECESCDYRKFTEQFIDGVVDVMTKNGISSVEELNRRLKGEES